MSQKQDQNPRSERAPTLAEAAKSGLHPFSRLRIEVMVKRGDHPGPGDAKGISHEGQDPVINERLIKVFEPITQAGLELKRLALEGKFSDSRMHLLQQDLTKELEAYVQDSNFPAGQSRIASDVENIRRRVMNEYLTGRGAIE